MTATDLVFAPLAPGWVLALLIPLGLGLALYAVARQASGGWLRLLAALALSLALLNPAVVREERAAMPDTALLVVDRSPSQDIGSRMSRADRARAHLEDQIAGLEGIGLRVIETGALQSAGVAVSETRLFDAVDSALADIPPQRRAGVILITDGQVHDVPATASETAPYGPVHGVITGSRDRFDRRIDLITTPSYGIVGRSVDVVLQVIDTAERPAGVTPTPVVLSLTRNGEPLAHHRVTPGDTARITLPIETGGEQLFEVSIPVADGELSAANNRAALAINGIRDRLRVLLVSGRPHNGERTWRNLLKSDPSVELVHFTILRPPNKQDGTPTRELSLIAFPIRELFEVRLYDFDLIIFDSYLRHNVLPDIYLRNIVQYVLRGGALLLADGPNFANPRRSLYYTALGGILPGAPSGDVAEAPFRPSVSATGRRHPVTADLLPPGLPQGAEPWGRWFSQVDLRWQRGTVVMKGLDERPLLLLDRVGEGRVAQMSSDQIWLWSRGFEGGGPQGELLRRLAHWLMQEPELEENVLRAEVEDARITVRRRSLDAEPRAVQVTGPDGTGSVVELTETTGGWAEGQIAAETLGVYQLDDGQKTAFAVVGRANPPELRDMRATEDHLAAAVESSGGGFHWLVDDETPLLRRIDGDDRAHGRGWLGLRSSGSYAVTGLRETSLVPGGLMLLLLLAGFGLAWRREGR